MYADRVYCPALGHEVLVTVDDEDRGDGVDAARLVCFDHDPRRCRGHCPLTGVAAAAMGARLAAGGPRAGGDVTAWCEPCGRRRPMDVVDGGRASCRDCGTATPWVILSGPYAELRQTAG